jgi:quercetin dioxygenase-like cupin family protein
MTQEYISDVINIAANYNFKYGNCSFKLYFGNKGEGLKKHDHDYPHTVSCCSGKIAIRKENLYLEMDNIKYPVVLKANEWHEIEILEDNTSFVNIYLDSSITNEESLI